MSFPPTDKSLQGVLTDTRERLTLVERRLAVAGTVDTSALIPKALVDAKGDLIVGTSNDQVGRQPVGSNGQVLTADSSTASGMKWASPAPPMPAGAITIYAGSAAPAGWLLCQGQAVSRSTYASLFAAIGTTYGTGDGSTTFNVPDLRGRVVVGQDGGQAEFDQLNEIGGTKDIGEQQMPIGAVLYGAGGTNANYYASINGGNQTNAYIAKTHRNPSGTQAAGSNMPPYRVLNYIISAT